MTEFSRRDSLIVGAGAAVSAAAFAPGTAHSAIPMAKIDPPKQPIEPGAELRVIRPTKFVDPDEIVWNENTAKFTKATGVKVRTDFVGWEDIRAQVAVAARTGAGPDVVAGWVREAVEARELGTVPPGDAEVHREDASRPAVPTDA